MNLKPLGLKKLFTQEDGCIWFPRATMANSKLGGIEQQKGLFHSLGGQKSRINVLSKSPKENFPLLLLALFGVPCPPSASHQSLLP